MERWNIFARELEDILVSRGLRLGHLDDRAGIHREKVRRLRQSLLSPKRFPVLNPSEMEQVAEAFQLKMYEVLHLRAAALAAAVEELLMERIDPESALLAADQILSMLSRALCDNYNKVPALDPIRAEQNDLQDATDLDKTVEGALLAIDRATKSLYHLQYPLTDRRNEENLKPLSAPVDVGDSSRTIPNGSSSHRACPDGFVLGMTAQTEAQIYTRQAHVQFEVALAILVQAPEEIKAREDWQVWYDEAQKGLRGTTVP